MDNRNGETPAIPEDAARRIQDSAESVGRDVKNAAISGVETAREKAGDASHTTAERLRGLADQAGQDLPWLATALGKSATGLDKVTDSLTRGDIRQCMSELSDFARRQPAVFLGASVALGFALSRVGKTALEGVHPVARNTDEPRTDQVTQPFDSAIGAYPRPTGV